jgi:subtilisin family serine protease
VTGPPHGRARRGLLVVTALVALAVAGAATSTAVTPVSPAQARASQWWLSTLGVTAAQQATTGAGVKVCLVDSGVDAGYPDLRGTTFGEGTDLSGLGSANGLSTIDLQGHGTSMATFIAGRGQSGGRGLLGVAPDVEIIPVTINIDQPGDVVSDAVAYCADHGAQVINLSLAGFVDTKAVAYAQARDAVIVASAGNGGNHDELGGISGRWGVLAVAGVDRNLLLDPRSTAAGPFVLMPDDEPTTVDLGGVGVTAPFAVTSGGAIVPGQCPGGVFGPRKVWRADHVLYEGQCGTSISAAIVSGVAALVRAAHPELNAANVVNRILKTAKAPTDGSAAPSPLYGFGVIDANAAVTADVPTVDANPLGSCYTGSRGIWDPRVTPQRPEPEAHATLPPASWQDANPPPATATTGAGEPSTADEPASGTGVPVWALLAAGLALVAVVVAVLAIVLLTRRRTPPGALPPH